MNPSFQHNTDGVSDLQVLWEDGERVFCRGWRTDGEGIRSGVLAVLPAAARSPPAILDRLDHEYALRGELDDLKRQLSDLIKAARADGLPGAVDVPGVA